MRRLFQLFLALCLTGYAVGGDAESDSLIRVTVSDFMVALQDGDGSTASGMFSAQAMEQVDVMLISLKQSLDRDPDATIMRLNSIGYVIELEDIVDWETADFLSATLALPTMSGRYLSYELEIDSVTESGGNARVDMIFSTAAGVEIFQQAQLSYEGDGWKISDFMGITAFP